MEVVVEQLSGLTYVKCMEQCLTVRGVELRKALVEPDTPDDTAGRTRVKRKAQSGRDREEAKSKL